ncbi:DUF4352 domain-containing protein [Nocardia sp. 348MFTsu5.1]|uniref:DUF4352 domain-containing protein n=1 Tax=Nocardia sp. 348MFTsu5.1 TaxID=1172185 RepID=UPI0003709A0C|nr:DUF4352 domain-containing protein [Nocardia sp. 348MFTsu5.1]
MTFPPQAPVGGNNSQGVPGQQPQQPYQGGAPNWAPPPPPQKKRKKWPFIVGGIVAVIVIAIAAGGGDKKDEDSTAAATTTQPADAGSNQQANEPQNDSAPAADTTAGLNTPVRDGKFEFVVAGVEAGVADVGDNPYLNQQASGQFVLVNITVKNISDKPESFSPLDQKLFDAQGREFEADTTAMIAATSSDIPVWDKINPGNSVNIQLVFDMPADATPSKVELHDSMFSGGVEVKLA